MCTYDREQHEKWFGVACERNRLIGGITALVRMAQGAGPITITPEQAIEQIAAELAEHNTGSVPR